MLNRRFLRIKIMQALYAWFLDEDGNLPVAEKNLFTSINKFQELFLYLVSLLSNLHYYAKVDVEDRKVRKLPSSEDLNPNWKFFSNKVLTKISSDLTIQKSLKSASVSWQNDIGLVKKILSDIKLNPVYAEYMVSGDISFESDKSLVLSILSELLPEHDLLTGWLEDKNMHWHEDPCEAYQFLYKWIEHFREDNAPRLPKLFRDEEDDHKFISLLFCKTAIHSEEFEKAIDKHTQNWEVDRIASIDILLIKMAMCEIRYLPNIPVKVSMNEYIDIAKDFSTPQSGRFINGVLDKIVLEMKEQGLIQKAGRGLLET